MESLKTSVQILAYLSLIFTAVEVFLTTTQLWRHRHEAAVAASTSLMGVGIGLAPLIMFTAESAMIGHWRAAIDYVMMTGMYCFRFVVGVGIWVPGSRHLGFLHSLRHSLKRESAGIAELARKMVRPSSRKTVVDILEQVALIDDADSERAFVSAFADEWGMHIAWDKLRAEAKGTSADRLLRLNSSIRAYLDSSPSTEETAQLMEVIVRMVASHDHVSSDEDVLLEELRGMFAAHAGDHTRNMLYTAVVPQSAAQAATIASLLPNYERRPIAGGDAFVHGPFYSRRMAFELVEQHRARNFFSVIVESDQVHGTRAGARAGHFA